MAKTSVHEFKEKGKGLSGEQQADRGALALMGLVVLTWGMSWVVMKAMTVYIGPVDLIAARYAVAFVFLWLVEPRVNKGVETFFGPYAYRSNAAQYFNLAWPVCLGFWWTLQRKWGFRRFTHQWLLLSAILMAACPVISTSRGGALVMWALLLLSGLVLVLSPALLRTRSQLSPNRHWHLSRISKTSCIPSLITST